ncbi:hypothetical protein ACSDR0_34140 [Streptosporangium sp. G11]|uniref:hypothetical protein n=1 Tax=Streptosporangium sp. G11 TaxID=3436926 RepID=UPI003EC06F27
MTTEIDTHIPVAMASLEAVQDSWPSMVLNTAAVPEPSGSPTGPGLRRSSSPR